MLILSMISLSARDNPFEPVEFSKTTGKATYKKDTRESFKNEKVQLPSSARILKSVELHFQNLDGSVESKVVEIDKKIDWHDELVLKKVNDVEDVIITQIPQTSVEEKIIQEKPQLMTKKNKEINFKDIISFLVEGNNLHVKTIDKKIRDFLVTKPYKIVIDFKKEVSFYTKVYDLQTPKFSSITIGKHDGYYRLAIELDGQYLYDIQKVSDGYVITLK